MRKLRSAFLIVSLSAAFLMLQAGCSQSQPAATADTPNGASPPAEVASHARKTYTQAPPVGKVKQYDHLQAVIETERGNIFITFYPHEAPHTVASFVKLARDGFYDGLTFHRVVPGFVVQGGDPNGDGSGGPGYTLPAEFNFHKHLKGTVAMARTSDPNSAGSQFYICLDAAPNLDGQYTVFGQVTRGMEAVEKLQVGDHMLHVRIKPLQ